VRTRTPFPGDLGYMEDAWERLSDTQRAALADTSKITGAKSYWRRDTMRVLRRRHLVDHRDRVTKRGQQLITWALREGLVRR
jgi:hypothetical protein